MTRGRSHPSRPSRPSVVGTGLVALDVVVSQPPQGFTRQYAGGTCGNVLTILAFLGWDAFPLARTNGDFTSRWVRDDLSRFGVHTDYLSLEPTGPVPAIIEWLGTKKDGTPSHKYSFVCPTCGSRKPGHKPVPAKVAKSLVATISIPDVFFFDRVSTAAVLLAHEFREKGSLIVFEPSGVGDPKLFAKALALSHILKYSTDRLGDSIGAHRRDTVALEIETMGSRGLRFRSHLPACKTRGWKHLDANPVMQLKDAAGSGDWLTATLLDRIGRAGAAGFKRTGEKTLLAAFRFAQGAAAWNCGFEAPRGGMYGTHADQFVREVDAIVNGETPKPHKSKIGLVDSHNSSPDCACLHCQGSRAHAADTSASSCA